MKKDNRNYGIDFLRILAMVFVIMLHCLNRGGLLKATSLIPKQNAVTTLLNIIAYPAVDIFGLISGYVAYSKADTKYSRYIELWFQVVFYGLLINGIFNIFMPDAVTYKNFIASIFPVSNNLYWYFTAYTGLFILIPYLNKSISTMSENTLKRLFVLIFISYSILDTVTQSFYLKEGYSVIWLVLLYLMGATIKKCDIGKNITPIKAIMGIIVLYIVTMLYSAYGPTLKTSHIKITKDLLTSYTSPTILGTAILYVIGFSKYEFHKISKYIIKFFAPCAFAIYMINCHEMIWVHLMKGLFIPFAHKRLLLIVTNVIGFSLLFSLGALLIDKIRSSIFKVLKIDKLSEHIANLFKRIIYFITKTKES